MKRFRTLLPCIIGISLFLITGWAYAATFIVDNLGDVDDGNPYNEGDGANTLRKCIRLANETPGADTINFSVSGMISPTSALPEITDDETVIDASSQWDGTWPEGQPGITLDGTDAGDVDGLGNEYGVFVAGASNNTIGGTTAGERNIISGNGDFGVSIYSDNNVVSGNYIGTDYSGTHRLEYQHIGVVLLGASNTIGGTTAGERNIISGNGGCGVDIYGTGADGNKVLGNYIGTDVNGTFSLRNGYGGVYIFYPRYNTIGGTAPGEGNIIAFNHGDGVQVDGTDTDYNKISRNSIHDSTGFGIYLVDNGNDEIPAPVIISNLLSNNILTVFGIGAGADATVEIFLADSPESGEGETYLGSLTASEEGNFSGSIDVTGKGVSVGDPLVATTTHTDNNTSEFSIPKTILGEIPTPHALSLDGDGDYVEVPHDSSLSLTVQITVEAWINLSDFSAWAQDIVMKGSNATGYSYVLYTRDYDEIAFHLGGPVHETDNVNLQIHQWYHVAATYDGSEVKIFINGEEHYSASQSGDLTENTESLKISGDGSVEWFNGLIDEVRIWNVARTQEQIRETMNQPLENPELLPNLVGYWNFDDGTARDFSPNGNHGTLMGDADIIPCVST